MIKRLFKSRLAIAFATFTLTAGTIGFALAFTDRHAPTPAPAESTSTTKPMNVTIPTLPPTTTTAAPTTTAPPKPVAPPTAPPTTVKTLVDIVVKQVSYSERVSTRDARTGLPLSIYKLYGCEKTYKYSDYSSETKFEYRSTPCG